MWKIDEIFNVLGKERSSADQILITGVSIDSRTIKRGEIFIALEGENYDGHKFIEQALDKGASLVIANKTKCINKFPIITNINKIDCRTQSFITCISLCICISVS